MLMLAPICESAPSTELYTLNGDLQFVNYIIIKSFFFFKARNNQHEKPNVQGSSYPGKGEGGFNREGRGASG